MLLYLSDLHWHLSLTGALKTSWWVRTWSLSSGSSLTPSQELKHSGTPETYKGQFRYHNLTLKWPWEFADLSIHSNGSRNLAVTRQLISSQLDSWWPPASHCPNRNSERLASPEPVNAGNKISELLPCWFCWLVLQNSPRNYRALRASPIYLMENSHYVRGLHVWLESVRAFTCSFTIPIFFSLFFLFSSSISSSLSTQGEGEEKWLCMSRHWTHKPVMMALVYLPFTVHQAMCHTCTFCYVIYP